ncbi:N-methyltryptophan oxidase [Actinomadura rubteroloni]|uniref:N-methyltryptophan oxidase n=1 Tax=Actinomadura rubteroloni TaxID=1926885 RepID=A0A2P4UFD5_9ACTN|nr:tryptophan 7-halogenase [Actinomadura rubteroloni]POM23755.1 N-methyltryptophan oxidase [Actinomadura rubteroloni]
MAVAHPSEKITYDVIILGSGIAGSLLGTILARHGAKVLLLDAASHPRFAIGESTIPYTLVSIRTLAERYDVPEIATLATFTGNTRAIGPRFGVKRHFGFLLHHEDQAQDPREANQFNTPKQLLHEAAHLFRQDTDSFLFNIAIARGCVARQNFLVTDIDVDDSGVSVAGRDGEYRGRYLVDASGFRSPVAQKYGLREDPCRFKHHSRSIWNHSLNVTPTDDLFDHPRRLTPPVPWYQGTVHHMFERGWAWVIGFDNNKVSRNPLCSVGMTVDPRYYPKPDNLSPEEDFYELAGRFPDIARQFEGMKPVREWTSTGRLQYSSSTTVGDRWLLLSHAAGFLDPLFSRGLSNTTEAVNVIAWRLLRAVKDGDFSADRFGYVDKLQQGLFDYNDSLVNSAFISWTDYDLWSAVFRMWTTGANSGVLRLQRALSKYRADGREQHLLDLEKAAYPGLYWPDHDGFAELYETMVKQCEAVEAGATTPREAADLLYDRLQAAPFVPKHFGFVERDVQFLHPDPVKFLRMLNWARKHGDPDTYDMIAVNGREVVKARLKGRKLF